MLVEIGGNPIDLFNDAKDASPDGQAYLEPGLVPRQSPSTPCPWDSGLVLGTAGLPHILMRFFTVPNAKAARASVVWAVGLIGAFYVMTTMLGFGGAGDPGREAPRRRWGRRTETFTAPLLAEKLGGGAGTSATSSWR